MKTSRLAEILTADHQEAKSRDPFAEGKLDGLPTIEQLATIAARLAPKVDSSPEQLADAAMKLWFAARERIYVADKEHEIFQHDLQTGIIVSSSPEESFLSTDEYPVTRDQFLEKMMPPLKGRHDKLAQMAKAFVRYILHGVNNSEPTQEEIDRFYGRWPKLENEHKANMWARQFDDWHRQHKTEVRRAAALKSSKTRKKRKARPPRRKIKAILKETLLT